MLEIMPLGKAPFRDDVHNIRIGFAACPLDGEGSMFVVGAIQTPLVGCRGDRRVRLPAFQRQLVLKLDTCDAGLIKAQ